MEELTRDEKVMLYEWRVRIKESRFGWKPEYEELFYKLIHLGEEKE